ncbi:MAG: hypothetical protein B9S30_08470 [Verrucomicrobiia bacterium Tous-C5FEB]|nr:MAG: hypothetical protein B9S30_08470 [Verrucomicrobiae bacterium Tous-C5FEB]
MESIQSGALRTFYPWLYHLDPGRPWIVPLQVLKSEIGYHFFILFSCLLNLQFLNLLFHDCIRDRVI